MDCYSVNNFVDALLPLQIGGFLLFILFAVCKSIQALVQRDGVFVDLRLGIFLGFASGVLFFGGLVLTHGCSFFASNYKSNLGPLLLSISVPLFSGVAIYKNYSHINEMRAVRIPVIHALSIVISGGWMIAKGIILFFS